MIEFLCPNGHRIRCPAEQAGRAAKCPKCGVKFRVPEAAGLDIPASRDSDSNVSIPDFTDSGFSDEYQLSAIGGGIKKNPQIEFLCPNGHRLFGPSNLQGKPGECPECGSRFIIPIYDDEPDPPSSGPKKAPEPTSTPQSKPAPVARTGNTQSSNNAVDSPTTISHSAAPGQSIAELFEYLWFRRDGDSSVEIRLRDGETIVPHQFLEKASRLNRIGMFVVKDGDGKISLVAVVWDSIARITLRGLTEVPSDLAD